MMPNAPAQGPNDAFLLGEIKATVTGTAEDVKAIRLDMGEHAKRISSVENRIGAIEAEREVLVPQYTNWKHNVSNEVQTLMAWKAGLEGSARGVSGVGAIIKWAWPIGAAVVAFVAGHYIDPAKTPVLAPVTTTVVTPRP